MSDFGSKLLSSFLMSAIYSSKYLSYTQTSSCNVETHNPGLGHLGAAHF